MAFSLKCAQSVVGPAGSEMGEINFRSEMKQAASFNSCLSINAAINASSREGILAAFTPVHPPFPRDTHSSASPAFDRFPGDPFSPFYFALVALVFLHARQS